MKVLVFILASVGLLAQDAQPAKQQLGRVIGEVTAKEGGKLTVKADGTGSVYTVSVGDKTSFIRVPPGEKDLKKGAKIAAGDVSVGDRVMARGTVSEEQKSVPAVMVIVMTKSDLEQKQQREHAEWTQRGSAGKVMAVTADEITISSRTREGMKPLAIAVGPKTAVRRYAPDSIRFNDAKPSSSAEIKVGDQLRVLGDKSADGAKITAETVVFGTFRTIPATVISVDAATGEIKVNDLDTKKPLIVKTTADSQIKKLPEMAARMMAVQVNGAAAGGGAPGGAPRGQGMRPQGPAGAPGAPSAGVGVRPGGQPGGEGPGGGNRGGFPGGPGGGARGGDLSQMLERLPALPLADLKPGDALIISSTAGVNSGSVTAITVLAGVEPILQSAPRSAGQINLGGWSLDMSMPQ